MSLFAAALSLHQTAHTRVSRDWLVGAPAAGKDGKRSKRGRTQSPVSKVPPVAALGRGADSKAAIRSAIAHRLVQPTARHTTRACLRRAAGESNRGRPPAVARWPLQPQ